MEDQSEPLRCPLCNNPFSSSGLHEHERDLSIGDIDEVAPVHRVLKVAGATILENGAGFVGVHGTTGSVKSEWGKILVASFCRKGAEARYVQAHALEQALFGVEEGSDGDQVCTINGAALEIYKRIPVLVIDETQRVNWKVPFVANHFCDMLESRYRAAGEASRRARRVTVLISQYDFADYAPDNIVSRLRDGSFQVPWPDDVPRVEGSYTDKSGKKRPYIDRHGLVTWPIKVEANDYRPYLPTAMRPISAVALMHPDTNEVLEEVF